MAQRRHHYESAFEGYLRSRRIPYIAVDEARKTLLPRPIPELTIESRRAADAPEALKSFDFVVYTETGNLLVDVKGRHAARPQRGRVPRLESWVTEDDVTSLARWEPLFGPDFRAAFAFLYCHDEQPPDGELDEIFEDHGRWYALRIVELRDYTRHMKQRSPRWRTLHLAPADFWRIGGPLCAPAGRAGPSRAAACGWRDR